MPGLCTAKPGRWHSFPLNTITLNFVHRSQKNLLNNGWTMVLALRHWRKAHWNTSRWLWKHLNILLLTVVMKPDFPVLKNISSTEFGPLQPFLAKLWSASCCALNVTVNGQSRCAVFALCLYAFQSAIIITIIQVILNIMYKCNKKNELRSLKSITQHETANLSTTCSW